MKADVHILSHTVLHHPTPNQSRPMQWMSHHGGFSDGAEAVDEDVAGDIDRRTWWKQSGFFNTTDDVLKACTEESVPA